MIIARVQRGGRNVLANESFWECARRTCCRLGADGSPSDVADQVAYRGPVAPERITIDPAKIRGVPCVRGMRIPVATVLGQLAAGRTTEQILSDFPDLEAEDIAAVLEFAADGEVARAAGTRPA